MGVFRDFKFVLIGGGGLYMPKTDKLLTNSSFQGTTGVLKKSGWGAHIFLEGSRGGGGK